MDTTWIWIASIVGTLFAFFLSRRTPKNLPLDWDTLATFLCDPEEYEVIVGIDDGGLRSDFGIQFRSEYESVKYFITEHVDQTAETIDLYRYGSMGFIVTFIDGKVSVFQRIGGRTTNGSTLTPAQLTSLEGILKRTRTEAKKYR